MKTGMKMEGKTTAMMKRPMMNMPAMGAGMPTGSNMEMMMVPRCMFKMEKCKDGMKISCMAQDEMSASMMQNLCTMLNGGMIGFQMMINGMPVMNCNMMMGMCKCDMTMDGMIIACTSGDAQCCKMIQDCCHCMMTMMECGCMCCMTINGTPVCCGTCC